MPTTSDRVPNRYSDATYVITRNDDGSYTSIISFRVPNLDLTAFSQTRQYRVRKGDTLDKIALRFYGIPEFWYIINDANYLDIFYPLDVLKIEDQVIQIPPVNLVRAL